jgi:glycosyltransferase involved in cell wall biosynthesis
MSARQKKTPGPKVLIAAGNGHITEVEMIKGLHHSGVNIHAAFASTSPHLQALTDAGVPTRSLDLKGNADFRNALKVRGWIKDEQFEIVHGLANRQVANFIWASYGLPNKLIAYRGAIGHVSRWDPTCYIKWLSPRINKIICVSQAVERDLAANGVNPAKLITIYKGHDLSWYAHLDQGAARLAVEREFNIPNDVLLIGMAANIRAVKGADLLVSALEALPGNVHAMIIGDIRDKRLLDRVDQSAARDRIHCTGYRHDAASLIGALDINCAPSRREGLPKTVIEGLAQGVPTVVSNAGGLTEMVDHGKSGYVFPIDDLGAFIQCVCKLIDSSDLRKMMGERGKTLVQKRFDVRSTITSTSRLYKQLFHE